VAAAVNFARENNLRLVVKGAGHSYLGTSNAPDSLLVWTRVMNKVALHDAFVGQGCEGRNSPVPAVSAEAGAMWIDLYHAVTTEAGRFASKLEESLFSFTPGFSPVIGGTKRCVKPF